MLLLLSALALAAPGGKTLAVSVNTARDGDFGAAMAVARQTGLEAVSLPLAWDDIEVAPGVYKPDPNWLAIADAYYPRQGLKVAVGVNPIDTNRLRVPADLKSKSFDDPVFIERFNRLLDFVFDQLPHLDMFSLNLGNEVDIYLGNDTRKWAAFERFLAATTAHAKRRKKGLRVGVKTTFNGAVNQPQRVARLHRYADLVMITYYPMTSDFQVRPPASVAGDLERLVKLYPGRPLGLYEAGYPSAAECGSSPQQQARFVEALLAAWDREPTIQYLEFTWLHDQSSQALDAFASYYGLGDRRFRAFLGSLGLRTADGRDKPAFKVLKAHQRVGKPG